MSSLGAVTSRMLWRSRWDSSGQTLGVAVVPPLEPSVRKTALRRSPIKRKRGVRKRNAKRSAANRERAYGIKTGKRAWVVARSCHFCGAGAPSEPVHAKVDGIGRKADAKYLIPMCTNRQGIQRDAFGRLSTCIAEGCHRWQHRVGWPTFLLESGHKGADPLRIAADYEAEFQRLAHSGATTPERT
jgi:hypothetical protein